MENELAKIRITLEIWDKYQKTLIAEELKKIGETISIADFAGLTEEKKWEWYCGEFPNTVSEMKKNEARKACYHNDAAGSCLKIGKISEAVADMSVAEWSLRFCAQADSEMTSEKARSEMARMGVMAKLANDPRQKEKAFIFECWQAWQKLLDTYPSKAAFAKDMIAKCEHLKSQKKVEDWCREWEKANPAGCVSIEPAE
jgi:hypothetical protein